MITLRPYQDGDLEALYEICLVTGDAGKDASPLHNDRQLVGHIYSAPYGALEPHNVFVAKDAEGVAGYIVGTYDTLAFAEKLETDWFPALRQRYADPSGLTPADLQRVEAIMKPHEAPTELVANYPAHIHMNLLERLRGQRVGTRLLDAWRDQARANGVKRIHLGASRSNAGGVAFWTKSGFDPLITIGSTVWFGMTLSD
ncbi:MAG: GNAT family N-acetyltransferase [Devosia sp.]|uniref:GNAT family N-acetyltransferase n=1 Tax=unclassified Devosia TaxID=196773 RepID=UPI0019EA5F5D|nr:MULTISPECIES: GNAT family N-acetyltransferase [unclassified Devosia]MBF0679612.1 GNAT family N-acetyltransferase [Devosia sp.]WEJ32236.1 GNAT family N-acetyltransferase [Devosia sp. SD17-2]